MSEASTRGPSRPVGATLAIGVVALHGLVFVGLGLWEYRTASGGEQQGYAGASCFFGAILLLAASGLVSGRLWARGLALFCGLGVVFYAGLFGLIALASLNSIPDSSTPLVICLSILVVWGLTGYQIIFVVGQPREGAK